MFSQAANEVNRRMDLLEQGRSSQSGASSANDYLVQGTNSRSASSLDSAFESAPPLTFQSQNFALVAKCNKGLRLHSQSPGFNVLGFFPDKPSIIRILKKYKTKFDKTLGIDLGIVPVRAFAMIQESQDCTEEYILGKIEEIKSKYIDRLLSDRQKSIQNREEHKTGETRDTLKKGDDNSDRSTDEKEEESDEDTIDGHDEEEKGEHIVVTDSIKNITSPGKTCYTCSLIKDNIATGDQSKEPLFQLYASFDTKENAHNWIEKTGSKHITDIHIDCFKIGHWVFPELIESSKVKELYRNKEESVVMNSVKEQSEKVLDFKRECMAEGKTFKEINMAEREQELQMKNGKLQVPDSCFTIEKCEAGKLTKPVDPNEENQTLEWEFSKNIKPTN